MTTPPDPAALRKRVYGILITVAVAMACGRIASVQMVHEPDLHRDDKNPEDIRRKWPTTRPNPMPSFSSNDRSRWCTVRALVDEGTYVIGRREPGHPQAINAYGDHGIVFQDGWQTVDKVLKPDTNEFYSTKPPLLATLVAGEYWVLKQLFGWSIDRDAFLVMRTILVTINGAGWLLYLLLLARLVERFGTSDFGRLFVFAAGAFGTLMTPFLTTLNNHTLGTIGVMIVLDQLAQMGLLQPGEPERPSWWRIALIGLLCGFTVTNETPAAAIAALIGGWLLWRAPMHTLAAFVPALLLPLAALFLCNRLAIGQWGLAYAEFGGPWYQYAGSHWIPSPDKRGIDWARNRETPLAYAFHVLVGHHGLFSLTPIFLLSMVGMGLGVRYCLTQRGHKPARDDTPPETVPPRPRDLPYLGLAGMVLTLVVIGFYLYKSDNYGGWTSGPRWLMWLTPIWLLAMLPVADRLSLRRWGRILCYVLLAISVFSVSYPAWNPWRHPWIYNWMEARGWIPY